MQVLSTSEAAAVEAVTDAIHAVGESPVWRAAEGALYWVDIPARRIHRLDTAWGKVRSWRTDEMVACIAFAVDGTLVAGMESGIFALELQPDGRVRSTLLAAARHPIAGMRFNDGRCDRQGRFWAGTMHMSMAAAHPVGALYRYTREGGLARPMIDGLLTQNGLAWSPRGERMYLSDSHPEARVIWAFDYECDQGTPYNRRVFADLRDFAGRPDGAAVDVDGCYWSCANDGAEVLRFTPAGRLDRRIALPVRKPSMCAFGGARLDTLYVMTIRPPQAEALAGQPLAGAVLALDPGTQGLAETDFGSSR
jgi:sugar lactone lactonase YvrE